MSWNFRERRLDKAVDIAVHLYLLLLLRVFHSRFRIVPVIFRWLLFEFDFLRQHQVKNSGDDPG